MLYDAKDIQIKNVFRQGAGSFWYAHGIIRLCGNRKKCRDKIKEVSGKSHDSYCVEIEDSKPFLSKVRGMFLLTWKVAEQAGFQNNPGKNVLDSVNILLYYTS